MLSAQDQERIDVILNAARHGESSSKDAIWMADFLNKLQPRDGEPPGVDLPKRRLNYTRKTSVLLLGADNPLKLHIAAGYLPPRMDDPSRGRFVECFVRGGGKTGSMLDNALDDISVLLSHLLRLGMTPVGVSRMLGGGERGGRATARLSEDGALLPGDAGLPTSIVGAVAEVLVIMQSELLCELGVITPAPASVQPGVADDQHPAR